MAMSEHYMVTNVKLEQSDNWIVACWAVVKIRRHNRVGKDQDNVVKTDLVAK